MKLTATIRISSNYYTFCHSNRYRGCFINFWIILNFLNIFRITSKLSSKIYWAQLASLLKICIIRKHVETILSNWFLISEINRNYKNHDSIENWILIYNERDYNRYWNLIYHCIYYVLHARLQKIDIDICTS